MFYRDKCVIWLVLVMRICGYQNTVWDVPDCSDVNDTTKICKCYTDACNGLSEYDIGKIELLDLDNTTTTDLKVEATTTTSKTLVVEQTTSPETKPHRQDKYVPRKPDRWTLTINFLIKKYQAIFSYLW